MPNRLRLADVQTADASGNAVFTNIPPPAPGRFYTGSLAIIGSPGTSFHTLTLGAANVGEIFGAWNGNATFGPVQVWGNESLIITSSGLTAGTQYTLVLVGFEDSEENASILWPNGAVANSVPLSNITTTNLYGAVIFGDGSDGAVTFDGATTVAGATRSGSTYTLNRDVYYGNATVNNGVTVVTNGFKLYCSGTLTNNGTIHNDGSNAAGAAGGAAAPQSIATGGGIEGTKLLGGTAGGNGGNGAVGSTPGSSRQIFADVIGNLGSAGGATSSFGAGTGGTYSFPSGFSPIYPAVYLDTLILNGREFAGGTGGGGGGGGSAGQAGGGGGGGGGVCLILASVIVNNGSISADGGNGANGVGPTNGGGGGGGGGGVCITVYNSYSGSGAFTAMGGTAGTGLGTGAAGTDGGGGKIVKVAV